MLIFTAKRIVIGVITLLIVASLTTIALQTEPVNPKGGSKDDQYFIQKYSHPEKYQMVNLNGAITNTMIGYPNASISKCTYKGRIVYVIAPYAIDAESQVYTADDQRLCSLGGFSGKGDGKCNNFGNQSCKGLWERSQT